MNIYLIYFRFIIYVLLLILSYLFGFYPILSLICNILGIENPLYIYADTQPDLCSSLGEGNKPTNYDPEELPFYKNKSFWIFVGLSSLLLIGLMFVADPSIPGTQSNPNS